MVVIGLIIACLVVVIAPLVLIGERSLIARYHRWRANKKYRVLGCGKPHRLNPPPDSE